MIEKLSHASVYVLDQDSAYDFYVNKLGFEVRTDARMDNGFRWLTVGPKGQPDMEIVLMSVQPGGMMPEERSKQLQALIREGAFGIGVFETPNCRRTYEELKAKGVEISEPEEQFYGIEAIVKDDSGNWFSLTERKH